MDLLKGEHGRYSNGRQGGREDDTIHPERLCDHDILVWRKADHSYTGRGGEMADIDYHEHVTNIRRNDIPEPRTIESFFERCTYTFRSDI